MTRSNAIVQGSILGSRFWGTFVVPRKLQGAVWDPRAKGLTHSSSVEPVVPACPIWSPETFPHNDWQGEHV